MCVVLGCVHFRAPFFKFFFLQGLEKKQLLTLVGLEIWDKLLVIGDLSCQRVRRRMLKKGFESSHAFCASRFSPSVTCFALRSHLLRSRFPAAGSGLGRDLQESYKNGRTTFIGANIHVAVLQTNVSTKQGHTDLFSTWT